MAGTTKIKITYGGNEYWLEADDAGARTVADIDAALKRGGLVRVEHMSGVASLGISLGVPITIEYIEPVDQANTFY